MNTEQNVVQQFLPTIRVYTPHDVQDAKAAMYSVCRMRGDGSADHVTRAAWLFLSGILVHLAYAQPTNNGRVSLNDVINFNDEWDSSRQLIGKMAKTVYQESDNSGEPTTHSFVKSVASMMYLMDERDLSNVITAAISFVHLEQYSEILSQK